MMQVLLFSLLPNLESRFGGNMKYKDKEKSNTVNRLENVKHIISISVYITICEERLPENRRPYV